MKPLKTTLILFLIALFLPACATVNKGTSDFFRIDSVPQGAVATTTVETDASIKARRKNPQLDPVYISCSPTPCAIKLNRRQKFVIKLEHPDFQTAEMFITNSRDSGSFTANMAATTATTAGTTVAGAVIGAGLATTFSAIGSAAASATLAANVTVGTFGLVPIETSFAFFSSTAAPTTISTGSALTAAIPPALAVTGGMILIDAASGANINLYPNPVVLELAPKGVPAKIDSNVKTYKVELAQREELERECIGRRSPSTERILKCRNLVSRRLSNERKKDARKAESNDEEQSASGAP